MVQISFLSMIPTGRLEPVGETLNLAIQRIVQVLDPEKIILFGSYAHGNPTPDSDVDLLIIIKTNLPRAERSWQVSKLLIPRPFPLDIIVKTPSEITQALEENDFFIKEIISQGIVLYERD